MYPAGGGGMASQRCISPRRLVLLTLLPLTVAARSLSYYDYPYYYDDYSSDEDDYSHDSSPCPENHALEPHIIDTSGVCVGCAPITPGSHPYFVAISTLSNPFGVHCGGTLIAPDIVATAAHCIKRRMRAQVGRINLSSLDFDEYIVTRVSIHPEYEPETYHADIALLKLDRPVEGMQPATVIAASTAADLERRLENRDLSVMGFGRTSDNGRTSKTLLVGTVQHVRSEVCNGTDSYSGLLTKEMLCAIGDGVDACQGDSGGPLIRQTNENNFLVGVISYGIGCASERYPGVYANVNVLRPWIFRQVRQQETWRAVA